MRRRIGIYGGTFDPFHYGHLQVAGAALNAFVLDRMLFVPAYAPPHKRKRTISSPFHRMSMLALATADSPRMFVSTIELEAPSRPYTIETLGRLQNELHPARLFFIMGADSFMDVTSWHEYEGILSGYDVIVATRPGYVGSDGSENVGSDGSENKDVTAVRLAPELKTRLTDLRGGRYPSEEDLKSPRIYLTDYVAVDVSATDVREAIADGRSIEGLVPPPVAAYIEKYRLYRKS